MKTFVALLFFVTCFASAQQKATSVYIFYGDYSVQSAVSRDESTQHELNCFTFIREATKVTLSLDDNNKIISNAVIPANNNIETICFTYLSKDHDNRPKKVNKEKLQNVLDFDVLRYNAEPSNVREILSRFDNIFLVNKNSKTKKSFYSSKKVQLEPRRPRL